MSLKRIRAGFWARMKAGSDTGWKAFLGAIGVSGVIITFIAATQVRVPWKIIWLVGLFCFLVGLLATYVRGRITLLPDSLVDEMNSEGKYVFRFCSEENLREACEMTRPFYGHEYVEPETAVRWLRKNPKAFIEMVNEAGELCACFGILALTDSFIEQFIKGRLSDTQLEADDICSEAETKKCKRLYISGVIVRDHKTHKGHKRANVMIWAMLKYTEMIYGLRRKRQLFAVAVTKESERLMKGLGFQLACEGANRKDECNLYSYVLSKESWDHMISQVGDWSKLCKFELNQ
jgi:hypothetical protein